jgi:hypothetical protein
MEQRALKQRRRFIALAVALLAVGAVAAVSIAVRRDIGPFSDQQPRAPQVRAPDGVRIRVEVLNASRTRGLARRATMHLRDRGFDVVETGTADVQRDSTLVLDRSGHPEWAQLVARALGATAVASRPDTSRYLDVSVLLGATWRPPSEPFYP